MKNLVLSAAFGLDLSQVELFVKSLRRYYDDDIYFLIGPSDINLKEKLKPYNCNFIIAEANKKEISTKRFKFFLEFLKKKNLIRFFVLIVEIFIFNPIHLIMNIKVK